MRLDHYHSMEKAINELGYNPKSYTYAETVQLYLKERKQRSGETMFLFCLACKVADLDVVFSWEFCNFQVYC